MEQLLLPTFNPIKNKIKEKKKLERKNNMRILKDLIDFIMDLIARKNNILSQFRL
jgi:hypothetical protein